MTAAPPPRFLSLTERNLDAAEISRSMSLPRLNARKRLEVTGLAVPRRRLILPKLGITLTGFHSGPEEALAVTAFERGRWGDYVSRSR